MLCNSIPNPRHMEMEPVLVAIEKFEDAMAEQMIGRERDWAEMMHKALQQIVGVLRTRLVMLQAQRHCNELHRSYKLLTKTCELMRKLECVLEAFAVPPYSALDDVLIEGEQLTRFLWNDIESDPPDEDAA